MEALDMDRYSLRLRNNKQVIRVLQTWFDSRPPDFPSVRFAIVYAK